MTFNHQIYRDMDELGKLSDNICLKYPEIWPNSDRKIACEWEDAVNSFANGFGIIPNIQMPKKPKKSDWGVWFDFNLLKFVIDIFARIVKKNSGFDFLFQIEIYKPNTEFRVVSKFYTLSIQKEWPVIKVSCE